MSAGPSAAGTERVTATCASPPGRSSPAKELALFVQVGNPPWRRPGDDALLRLGRMEVAGSRRTQRVVLDHPLRVTRGSS
jgi:hypothetical protein